MRYLMIFRWFNVILSRSGRSILLNNQLSPRPGGIRQFPGILILASQKEPSSGKWASRSLRSLGLTGPLTSFSWATWIKITSSSLEKTSARADDHIYCRGKRVATAVGSILSRSGQAVAILFKLELQAVMDQVERGWRDGELRCIVTTYGTAWLKNVQRNGN